MVFPTSNPSPSIFSALFFFTLLASFPFSTISADLTNLIYKGCANQNFQDPNGTYKKNLKSLFDSLVSQSSQKTYFSSTFGDGQTAIVGTYQCRGDLSTSDCNLCVKNIPALANKLCGEVVAARVQLGGCYLRYEVAGFQQVPGTQFLFKICRKNQASGVSAGFADKRDKAFGMVENGVKNGSAGFYTGTYQSVYILGQCEGNLGSGDCGDCVKIADQRAKSDCNGSFSGQIYLQKCYISYNFYPNGVTSIASSSGSRHHTQRTVAIAVGGLAAFGFLVVCLMFVKQLMKKKHGGKHGDYY
ncbi:LOW QUALITY PROTEIN: plasmodesmata-located protein 1 [Pyrus x bretschneideri]|uniref:LOW QUALITY PROTEIN: plasmodesmata-located protein 1 n=1 Tax=Pyrus x bretschneideri TaxID=225117 RepID=UPI002030F2E2|nr:LOW QUALITY PROTEIN: plasmodesmata-located protein 1 [Pyrus x bretschneideri]